MRLALKLATGAGKTTVMAMIIAWQTINAVRRPGSTKFTRGFLIVTPGVRPKNTSASPHDDDQARTATPTEAIRAGADFLVVGRPILAAPDPRAAIQAIVDEITAAK